MREETQQESTSMPSLQERVDNSFVASGYTLLNGGTDNIIMINGRRDGAGAVDILLTYEGIKEVIESLKADTEKKEEPQEQAQ